MRLNYSTVLLATVIYFMAMLCLSAPNPMAMCGKINPNDPAILKLLPDIKQAMNQEFTVATKILDVETVMGCRKSTLFVYLLTVTVAREDGLKMKQRVRVNELPTETTIGFLELA